MTTRLLLISHASTPALRAARFPLDEPLDDDGRTRAKSNGASSRRPAHRALCGPERRTAETARALGLDPVDESALRDVDCGRWAGRSIDDVLSAEPEAFAAWMSDPKATPHGGESIGAVVERVTRWLEQLARADDDRVVAVTHPAVVRSAVLHALDAPLASFWALDVVALAMVRLHASDGRWRLRLGPDE